MATAISVDALAPGDHACLTFSDPDERLDIVAAFVRDGLRRADKVICFTESILPEQLTAELADRGVATAQALPRQQLSILPGDQSWLADGVLTGAKMVKQLARHMDSASREGYAGLRVSADMCWVNRPIAAAEQLPIFETEVKRLFRDGRLTAICQYDRDSFDAVTLAFAAQAHECTVAATVYYEDAVVRICRQHTPPGIRLAGEIDFSHVDELTLALNEALRLDHDIQVNLSKLQFIDAAAATAIVHAGLSITDARVLSVVCGGPVWKVLSLAGATEVPALRVVRTHGEH